MGNLVFVVTAEIGEESETLLAGVFGTLELAKEYVRRDWQTLCRQYHAYAISIERRLLNTGLEDDSQRQEDDAVLSCIWRPKTGAGATHRMALLRNEIGLDPDAGWDFR